MHPIAAWAVGAAYISYRYGYKCKQFPRPYRYIALTAFVSLASLIPNTTASALLAWGSLLGVYFYGQTHKQTEDCKDVKQKSTSQEQTQTLGSYTTFTAPPA